MIQGSDGLDLDTDIAISTQVVLLSTPALDLQDRGACSHCIKIPLQFLHHHVICWSVKSSHHVAGPARDLPSRAYSTN